VDAGHVDADLTGEGGDVDADLMGEGGDVALYLCRQLSGAERVSASDWYIMCISQP
jgi:hypothetical protein